VKTILFALRRVIEFYEKGCQEKSSASTESPEIAALLGKGIRPEMARLTLAPEE
jgi:hypothetical protein